MMKKSNKKRKQEWSKLMCGLILGYGFLNGFLYHIEVFLNKAPDATLATQCVITIIGAYISYLFYQLGLKNSRNKYGVDCEGNPYRTKNFDPEE